MKYQVTCVNCKNEFPVEITDRQRHEEDMDISVEYAQKFKDLDFQRDVAIAMYEQKCTDHRGRMAQEGNLKLEQERHDNRILMEKFKIKAKQWPYNK